MSDVKKCPEGMVYIPEGRFRMGSTNGDSDEQPVHDVYVSGFCMDQHEVTNAEYSGYQSADPTFELIATSCKGGAKSVIARGDDPKALAKKNKAKLDGEKVCALEVKDVTSKAVDGSPSPRGFDGLHQPVVNVDWHEAKAFCESQGKRLPTEAEWEKAAKGPEGYDYGTKSGKLNHREAHYDAEATADVCSYPENGYGLCDMSGNVWEWMADWYDDDAYSSMESRDPEGPSEGEYKVLRGGSWLNNNPRNLRAALRLNSRPGYDNYYIGFRCVSAPQDSKE